jgi:hypothetical protein
LRHSEPSSASQETESDHILREEEEELTHPRELDGIDLPSNEMISRQEDPERDISSLPAPYEKFPPEILGEIFVLCSTPTISLPPRVNEPLLILTQICKSWHEIVLEMAELWASILVLFGHNKTDDRRITAITEQWLGCTGTTCSLSITVDCTQAYATIISDKSELVSSFIALVVSHAHHLQDLDLAVPFQVFLLLFDLPCGAFSTLETMALWRYCSCPNLPHLRRATPRGTGPAHR